MESGSFDMMDFFIEKGYKAEIHLCVDNIEINSLLYVMRKNAIILDKLDLKRQIERSASSGHLDMLKYLIENTADGRDIINIFSQNPPKEMLIHSSIRKYLSSIGWADNERAYEDMLIN